MKRALSLVLLPVAATLAAAAAPPGFTALFNGRDLTGWRGGTTYDHRKLMSLPESERAAQIAAWTKSMTEKDPKTGLSHWRVEGRELVNDGTGDYATTEKEFRDFELLLDYKIVAGAGSGIYLRGVPQVQIWDYNSPDQKGLGYEKGSGGLWNNDKGAAGKDPLVRADSPIGEWNHFRLVMVGSRVSVWLNKQLVVDHAVMENYYDKEDKTLTREQRRPVPAQGPIQLQTHGGATTWRNIYLREIDSAEACRILESHGRAGFQPIATGGLLGAWSGELRSVSASGGSLTCTRTPGALYWKQPLREFQDRMQFKVPTGTKASVAIGRPGAGKGITLVRELPVPDPGVSRGAPSPYHADGEWNFQEVTVTGSTLELELNGTPVLDVELASGQAGGAMTSAAGANYLFGLISRGDPVQFRNLAIRRP